jgi:hypothetical protein
VSLGVLSPLPSFLNSNSSYIFHTFFGIIRHEFQNIYIRHRFENADNVTNKVGMFAGGVELELEGRGNTNPDATPMTQRRVGSNSASPFPYRRLDRLVHRKRFACGMETRSGIQSQPPQS